MVVYLHKVKQGSIFSKVSRRIILRIPEVSATLVCELEKCNSNKESLV